jgi:exodeoxyribonuclease V alpha subunit
MPTEEVKKEDKITGVLNRIIFKSDETGYHILSLDVPDLKDITVTINQPNLFEGVTYEFKGEWTVHPKFGNQFKASIAYEVQPSTKEGLRAYLQSSFFPGIGPVIANRII